MEQSRMDAGRRGLLAATALGLVVPWSVVAEAADGRLHVVAELSARSGSEARLRLALEELARAARREDGCERYELFQDVSMPGRFLTQEIWRNDAALQAHLTSSTMKAASPTLTALAEPKYSLSRLRRLL